MKVKVTETGLWNNNNKKIFWRLFRSNTLKRDFKYEVEFKLIPEKSENISVN